jgi:hypothetical protein
VGGYRGNLTRITRVGLSGPSGWSALAVKAFWTQDTPNTAANTFNDLTSSASGFTVAGTGAATLDALTSAATGGVGAKGTSAATLLAATSAASGATVTGTSAVTLATIVSTATGTSAGGSSAVTLSALTSTASGTRGAAGTSARTLNSATSTASGQVTIIGSVASTLDALTSLATDAALPVTIDFEDGTIPASLLWSGDPGTVVSRPDGGGGTLLALQFRDIEDDEETSFELYAEAHAPGSLALTVRFEVSSEEGYDFLRVIVDDVDVLGELDGDPGDEEGRSGITGGFLSFTVNLSEGGHSLRFGYFKDGSADDGDDTAWISSITYPVGIRPVIAANTLDALISTASGTTPLDPNYRLWRVNMSEGDVISEIEFRATPGGADLTDTLAGTPFSINEFYPQYPDYQNNAYKAFDNSIALDLDNIWISVLSFGYVGFTFDHGPDDITQVMVNSSFGDAARNFTIERKKPDDFTWEIMASVVGECEGYLGSSGTTSRTYELTGPDRRYETHFGRSGFVFDPIKDFCDKNHITVSLHTTSDEMGITKLLVRPYHSHPYTAYPLAQTTDAFFVKGVIYAADGVGGKPGTLLATTAERTQTQSSDNFYLAGDWFDLEFASSVFLPRGSYYLGIHVGGDQRVYGVKTSDFGTTYTAPATYTSGVPASWPGGETTILNQSALYAVYPVSRGYGTLDALTSDAVGTVNATPIEATGESTLEALLGEASGIYILPVTGTAATALEALLGSAFGARGVFRPRQSLHGTYRPQTGLNATWVDR